MIRLSMKTLIIAFFIYGLCWATIINIPADYPTIQQGIDASSDGDTVLVQPGTYVENINFNGYNIVLGSLFLTTGDTSYISTTIIDGDSSGSVVIFGSGEDSTTMIAGFSIQNGDAFRGSGIRCYQADPKIMNNKIRLNYGTLYNGRGAGIFCEESDSFIGGNIISENMVYGNFFRGSGIYVRYCENLIISGNLIKENNNGGITCAYSDILISNNIIIANYGSGEGGGIDLFSSSPIIINNIINGNSADGFGGGINCNESVSPYISNNIITYNVAQIMSGGGISCRYGSFAVISNNVIVGNSAHNSGGGIYSEYNSNIAMINTIVRDNNANTNSQINPLNLALISYSNIQDGYQGEGNIDVDPLFRDPQNSDYRLMSVICGDSANSPCIDSGHPDSIDIVLGCLYGLGGNRSDMGAYGGNNGDWTTSIRDNDNIEYLTLPDDIIILQNYPNPFNAQTTIRFALPNSQNVQLTIYDLLGRQVQTLLDEYRQAGVHTITFDASHLSSGVYFYRLRAGDMVEAKRMILLK